MRPNDHRGATIPPFATIMPPATKDESPTHCSAVLASSLTLLASADELVDDLEAKLFGAGVQMGQQMADAQPPPSVSFSSQLHDLNAGLRTLSERLASIRNELVGA